MYPGGGFNVLAIDIEGTEICDWLISNGIACALLKYRVPCEHQGPYRECASAHVDAQRAMSIVRSRAAEWRIDPNKIGVIGFSAGAHIPRAGYTTNVMPKLLPDVIDATHIESFLNTNSDFAFEIKVLRSLRRLGLSCRHGGTYEDPVTGKTRQFDIYAEGGRTDRSDLTRFSFAVECKNLRRNFPLVVHRLPRDTSEAYLDVMFARPSSRSAMTMPDYSERLRLVGTVSPYVSGEPVGKAFDQVGRSEKGEIFGNDQDVFEKTSQALNAAQQLLEGAYERASTARPAAFVITVPVLVVPARTLWTVDYDHDGNVTSGPQVVRGAAVYVGKEWSVGGKFGHACTLSHLEIVGMDYLDTFVDTWRNDLRLTSSAIVDFIRETQTGA